MKLLNESVGLVPEPKAPFERSPRQCSGPWFCIPRKVWVVMGPFIGWNSLVPASPFTLPPAAIEILIVIGLLVTVSSGLPRSQARSSWSPKMWQLPQDDSPFADEKNASLPKTRPLKTLAGSRS